MKWFPARKDRFSDAEFQRNAHGKPVGPAVARELYGALAHADASLAILATANGVSETWAADKPIRFLQPDHFTEGRAI